MKILLINPPNDLGMGNKRFNYVIDVYQPLGLAYIAAVLEKSGFQVRIVDAKAESLSINEILKRVTDFNPYIIGISSATPDFSITKYLAQKIKSLSDYIILIGGPHVSALPEEAMKDGYFDYGVIGEGENTTLQLVNAVSQRNTKEIPNIKGLIFHDGSRLVRTPPQMYTEDLDTLPFPARHLLQPFAKYSYLYYKHLPLATVITSRGCPYQCIFCDHSVFGYKIRMRSTENILDEIEMLVNEYGVREVIILDDLFTLNCQRVMEFCSQFISRKLKIVWSCMSRADSITLEMLKAMKKAGCWRINYGIESGNQEILYKIKKNITLEDAEKAIKWTRKMNIRTTGFFILGLPGDNEISIQETLAFAKKLPLDRVVFFIAQPIPGTELYEMALGKGEFIKGVDYRYYHFYCFPEKLPYITNGLSIGLLRRYRKKAYREFYLRPSYVLRQLTDYHEFRGLASRVGAFLKAIM